MDGTSVTALSDFLFTPDPRTFAARAAHEQVLPQVLREMQRAGWDRDPRRQAHVEAIQAGVRQWTLHEALERQAVIEVLARAGRLRILFFKGAALAFTTYDAPADRMRVDWDLLVDEKDVVAVQRVLEASGFRKDLKTPRGLRNRQESYRRPVSNGECAIDVHTGVVNAPALADRIRFDELFERSVPMPALHAGARGTDHADALLLACLHRLSHHSGEERLIWDYDIHLLTGRVDGATLTKRAAAWRVGPLVAAEIKRVADRASARVPDWVDALASQPSDVLSFARANRSRGDDFLIDWRGLSWRDRATLVRETLLPDPAFMRATSGSSLPLPLLYVRRFALGVLSWISRPRSNRPV